MYFNTNLAFVRKQKKVSQLELAKKIGVDQSTISLWEKGMDTTVENAIKVAEALDVPIPDFLGRDLRFDNATQVDINDNVVKIPVLGVIKAGIPIEAQQNILEYIEIPKQWTTGGRQYYGLKINGDSMYPKYAENDTVVFEDSRTYGPDVFNNKDCAVMVNGDDATFKKVLFQNDSIILQPYNSNYQIQIFDKEQIEKLPVKIIGIAKEKRTKID